MIQINLISTKESRLKTAIFTLGCKVNQADSQSIQDIFTQAGFEIVPPEDVADIYIINTCVVTNIGQQKSRRMIRRFVKSNPEALVVVTGCYPQTAEQEVASIDGVGLIIGNQDRCNILELVQQALVERKQLNKVRNICEATAFENMPAGTTTDKTRAFLKIQEGCNQFCSYCIIPYARGRLRSRSASDIHQQTEILVQKGFKEIVLLGIHLGAWGKDLSPASELATAVKSALAVKELPSLRLGSLECIEVGDELLQIMEQDNRLAKHLHLPLQSGSNAILKAMNRPYSCEDFGDLVDRLRSLVPDIAITTDIIVGFPGETEEMFAETMALVEKIKFADIHIFPFSKRKNTPAEKMPAQVTNIVKQKRVAQLTTLAEKLRQNFLYSCLNKEHKVLFEQKKHGLFSGYTSNYIKVYVQSDVDLTNQICTVRTTELYSDGLKGEIK